MANEMTEYKYRPFGWRSCVGGDVQKDPAWKHVPERFQPVLLLANLVGKADQESVLYEEQQRFAKYGRLTYEALCWFASNVEKFEDLVVCGKVVKLFDNSCWRYHSGLKPIDEKKYLQKSLQVMLFVIANRLLENDPYLVWRFASLLEIFFKELNLPIKICWILFVNGFRVDCDRRRVFDFFVKEKVIPASSRRKLRARQRGRVELIFVYPPRSFRCV